MALLASISSSTGEAALFSLLKPNEIQINPKISMNYLHCYDNNLDGMRMSIA
jgi:hypothetical protein